jgi:hypothetical protein
MSFSELPNRPLLSSPELDYESDRAPLGKMPVLACLAGVLSLLSPLSVALLPLSILAAALGAVVFWRQVREANSTGKLLAQIGLGLGVATGAWSIVAARNESHYLYAVAAEYGKIYLDKISQDEIHEALELRLPVRQRQIAGTNLKEYYATLSGEAADTVDGVMQSPTTKFIAAAGADADWQFVRGVRVGSAASQKIIAVEFQNMHDPSKHVEVNLQRESYTDESGIHALWIVKEAYQTDQNGKRI